MKIDKYKQLPPAVEKILAEHNASDIRIGDIFIGGTYASEPRIKRIREIKYEKKSKTNDEAYVEIYYDKAENWDATEWTESGHCDIKEFTEKYQKLTRTVKEHFEEAADVIAGKKSIDSFRDTSTDNVNESTALIHKNSKQGLIAMQQGLEEKRKSVELVAQFVTYEMDRKKRELEKIKDQMYGVVAQFQKKIDRIMRVITTIELYLGIDEEIYQLQSGPAADEKQPISFRQALLYMDEETGHWQSGGLDFQNIDWFDEWLVRDANFKKLLPEQKGIVVFRPRRKNKDYGNDRDAELKNIANRVTYFLIRNGENLYRIYTEKIIVRDRLFPKREELEQLLKEIENEDWDHRKEEKKEKVEDITYQYRKRAMLLQGLIDRTDIFKPMPEGRINIFNMDATPGAVNFIYDDEAALPSGRDSFDKWKKQINEKITEGSRVLLTGHFTHGSKYYQGRFFNKYREGNSPNLPGQRVYTVENFKPTYTQWMRTDEYSKLIKKYPGGVIEEKEEFYGRHEKYKLLRKTENHWLSGKVNCTYVKHKGDRDGYEVFFEDVNPKLTIKYFPSDKARSGWGDYGHDRKNKIRFKIKKDDEFILNYDQIDLDDIEFYLTNRVDRPNYLYMMPVLEKIKQERLIELQNEKEFMRFIADRNKGKIEGCDDSEVKQRVVQGVIWWKYKNKWKRPIAKDDTLALRMIEHRIQSKNYHKLSKAK